MWFKNLKIFRLNPDWSITKEQLLELVETQAFIAGHQGQGINFGWVPVVENGDLVHKIENFYFLTLQAEKKLLPSTVINQFTREKASEIEEQQGYKPGRKQMRDIKEEVTDTLLPKAFSIFRQTRLCLDLENHWLLIDTGSVSKADEVITQLVKILDPMPIQSFMTELSPSSAMTEWLFSDQAPAGFTIDPQAEFKSTEQDKATVKFNNIIPDHEEVIRHVESGKVCTRLALTWQDRISFTLNENLEIKKITPLDVLEDARQPSELHAEEQFDADLLLMGKEYNQLFNDLILALNGEKKAAS